MAPLPAGEEPHGSVLQVGEFQMFDRRAMASLAEAAERHGHPEWGHGTPPGIGALNDVPQETPFFMWNGGWQTPRGHFFLSWYSQSLRKHADSMLAAAVAAFYPFMSPSAQAAVREQRPKLAMDLPSDPPSLRRNGSEQGIEALSPVGDSTVSRALHSGSTGSLRTRQDVASGSTSDFVELSRATSAAGSAATLTVDQVAGAVNGVDSCVARSSTALPDWEIVPRPNGSAPVHCTTSHVGGSTAAGCAIGVSPTSAWETARWNGLDGGGAVTSGTGGSSARRTRKTSSVRSSNSTLSLQSLQPLKRVPLRLSMKLAGVFFCGAANAVQVFAGSEHLCSVCRASVLVEGARPFLHE